MGVRVRDRVDRRVDPALDAGDPPRADAPLRGVPVRAEPGEASDLRHAGLQRHRALGRPGPRTLRMPVRVQRELGRRYSWSYWPGARHGRTGHARVVLFFPRRAASQVQDIIVICVCVDYVW